MNEHPSHSRSVMKQNHIRIYVEHRVVSQHCSLPLGVQYTRYALYSRPKFYCLLSIIKRIHRIRYTSIMALKKTCHWTAETLGCQSDDAQWVVRPLYCLAFFWIHWKWEWLYYCTHNRLHGDSQLHFEINASRMHACMRKQTKSRTYRNSLTHTHRSDPNHWYSELASSDVMLCMSEQSCRHVAHIFFTFVYHFSWTMLHCVFILNWVHTAHDNRSEVCNIVIEYNSNRENDSPTGFPHERFIYAVTFIDHWRCYLFV